MFQNVTFPAPTLIHGIQRQYFQSSTIVGNGSTEYRIQKFRNGIHKWVLNQKSFNPAGLDELLNFLDAAEYSLFSFKFADPLSPEYKNFVLPHANDHKWYLVKPGANNNQTNHPIYHLGNDVVLTVNNVPTAFTISIENKIPMIHLPGVSNTDVVRISGKYYHAVRLDQSSTNTTVAALNSDNSLARAVVDEIVLTEVFEY